MSGNNPYRPKGNPNSFEEQNTIQYIYKNGFLVEVKKPDDAFGSATVYSNGVKVPARER